MRLRFVIAALLLGCAACSTPAAQSETVALEGKDYRLTWELRGDGGGFDVTLTAMNSPVCVYSSSWPGPQGVLGVAAARLQLGDRTLESRALMTPEECHGRACSLRVTRTRNLTGVISLSNFDLEEGENAALALENAALDFRPIVSRC